LPGRYQWQNRFRENVCRWTMPREVILALLSQTTEHLTAKDIYGSLYSMYPGIGLTTVYRTLELLHRLGLVHRIAAGDSQSRYALKKEDKGDHHHHLICTRCGKIIDYRDFVQEELELVKKTEEALAKKHHFTITDHNIEFLGLCEKCR
jgi:Fur family transcriptional regulator, ferric uptake regulator